MTNIVEYSEKAIAVYGNTKPIKDKLKELGGRFNPHLKDGAGWVFSKSKREAVQQMISQTMGAVVTVMPEPPIYSKDYVSTAKDEPKPIPIKNKGTVSKFTDIIVTGFMGGEYTMPNHKVECDGLFFIKEGKFNLINLKLGIAIWCECGMMVVSDDTIHIERR